MLICLLVGWKMLTAVAASGKINFGVKSFIFFFNVLAIPNICTWRSIFSTIEILKHVFV